MHHRGCYSDWYIQAKIWALYTPAKFNKHGNLSQRCLKVCIVEQSWKREQPIKWMARSSSRISIWASVPIRLLLFVFTFCMWEGAWGGCRRVRGLPWRCICRASKHTFCKLIWGNSRVTNSLFPKPNDTVTENGSRSPSESWVKDRSFRFSAPIAGFLKT